MAEASNQQQQPRAAAAPAIRFTRTAIYKAIIKHDLHALNCAIQLKGSQSEIQTLVRLQDEQTRFSYLHLVVVVAESQTEHSLLPFIYALSNAGIDPEARDCRSRTALCIAVNKGICGLVTALLRIGCDQATPWHDYTALIDRQQGVARSRLAETFDKFSPGLWSAVDSNDLGTVYILINSWCRINVSRRVDADTATTLIGLARAVGASNDLIRLLEGYETTIEFVHATLAGDRDRMMRLLTDSTRPCDLDIMDISHQDSWTSPLRPRSLRDTAESLGHQHVLDLLPRDDGSYEVTSTRGTAKSREVARPKASVPSLNLSFPDDEAEMTSTSFVNDDNFSRSRPQYHSLQGSQRRRTADRPAPFNHEPAVPHNLDHLATPRKLVIKNAGNNNVDSLSAAENHENNSKSNSADLTPKAERKFGSVGVAASRKLRLDLTQTTNINNTDLKVGGANDEDDDATPTGDMPAYSSVDFRKLNGASATPTATTRNTLPKRSSSSRKEKKAFGPSRTKKTHKSTLCVIS